MGWIEILVNVLKSPKNISFQTWKNLRTANVQRKNLMETQQSGNKCNKNLYFLLLVVLIVVLLLWSRISIYASAEWSKHLPLLYPIGIKNVKRKGKLTLIFLLRMHLTNWMMHKQDFCDSIVSFLVFCTCPSSTIHLYYFNLCNALSVLRFFNFYLQSNLVHYWLSWHNWSVFQVPISKNGD